MLVNETKVTRGNATEIKSKVIAAAERGDAVLDWAGAQVVDSSSVAIVLAWIRVLQKKNLTPQLVNVPEKMVSLMRLYGTYALVLPHICVKAGENS